MVKWNPEVEKTFQAVVIMYQTSSEDTGRSEIVVQTDTSDVGTGEEGEEHLSRKFHLHERNYATVEKEALAIKWALETLRYLLGRPFGLIET